MEVRYTQETEAGAVVFQGVLEGPELTVVLEAGLNVLMKEGLIPFLSTESIDQLNIMDLPDLEQ